jgi:hypothetical protein
LRGQFESETGQTANAEFGAYVMQPFGSDLLIGLSNNPGNYDGALITRSTTGNTLTTERTLDEQGAHDMQIVGGRVFVPGADPVEPSDEWTLGNLYERSVGGTWTKLRTLPLTIHALGLWHDGSVLWVGGGMHTGDNVTWKGRVLRSTDDGVTWAAQVDVNNYRIYDVIGHAGKLYATGYDWTGSEYTQDLHVSSDGGATWSKVAGVTPAIKPRMIAFGTSLIVAGETNLYRVDGSHVVTTYALPFTTASLWNILATDGTNVYALANDGRVWRSSDLTSWTAYTYVPGAIAIARWSGVGLMISDSGVNARVWSS